MSNQSRWAGIVMGVVMGLLFSGVVVLAGNLEPSGGPTQAGSQMYTIEQIYERLNTGAAGSKMTYFTEPSSGPAGTGRTLVEIMEKLPALDDDNGAGPANVAEGKTYWGLTSGQWGLKSGSMLPTVGVSRTGQTTGYGPGDDGDLQKGVVWPNPRFTDNNNNGTVTDNLTGLIWLKNANCMDMVGGIAKSSGRLTWADALTWSNNLATGNCGLTDGSTAGQWRLPNVREMQSLPDYGFFSPALCNTDGSAKWSEGAPFTGVQSDYYWSSTTFASSTNTAWHVDLSAGGVYQNDKNVTDLVWPVRGGQ